MKFFHTSTALVLFLAAILTGSWLAGYRVNITPSMPLGVYRLTDEAVRPGSAVFFCLEPEEYIRLAADRDYVGFGFCPGGLRPLLKEVAGMPGDSIRIEGGRILVNGRPLPHSTIKESDSQGRPVPIRMSPTDGNIPAGHAFLLAPHDGSFDSRYFGFVPLAGLQRVEPVITKNKQ